MPVKPGGMQRNNSFLFVFLTVAFVTACVIPGAATPAPTLEPEAVNTFIVQTANAAATRTAQALPSNTLTATRTPTPRDTETSTPTATRFFVFILPGSTSSLSAPTLAGINNGTSNSNYGCTIFSTEPANNTVFAPRSDFIATWGVKNIGKKDWFRATMDYVYVSGDKLHEVSSYDLPKGVETGKNVFLPVEMATFKNPGTYTTTWALAAENIYFCKLTLTIIVR
jgi:hypothetical protein